MSSTIVDDDNPNNYVSCHIYCSNDNKIIQSVKSEILESDELLQTTPIQALFPENSTWFRKDILKEQLTLYATKHNFTITCKGDNKILCTRAAADDYQISKKKGKDRDFTTGPMKVGCTFGLKLKAMEQTSPKETVKNKRRRGNFKTGPVQIKSFNYSHSNGCNPCPEQYHFCCSRAGKYQSQIPIQVYWSLCCNMKRHPKKYIATSTIRSFLSSSYPPNHNISKQEIFQTRIRCRRLMPKFELCDDFKQFEDTLQSDSVYLKQIESDATLEEDEATSMIHELFDSMFNNNQAEQSVSNIDENGNDIFVWKFQDYLKMLSLNVKGFRYRLAIGNDGAVNGVVWMTATMRSNLERFGSYICLDCMKRVLNPLKWPYFAVALKNELDQICVGCEALMLQERGDAYKFLVDSAFEMCPGRLKDDVLVVSGDGFFNQDTLKKWGFFQAKFIADYWHLFDSGLKNRFGSERLYRVLEHNLRGIANARKQEDAYAAFIACREQLRNMNRIGGRAEDALMNFYEERGTYAIYMTNRIPGNRGRRGSSAAEQNHASVVSLLFGDKETKDYMEHVHVMIRDLFFFSLWKE